MQEKIRLERGETLCFERGGRDNRRSVALLVLASESEPSSTYLKVSRCYQRTVLLRKHAAEDPELRA
jgi:hypothetical protein